MDATQEVPLPKDFGAEQATLGAVLLDPQLWPAVQRTLATTDFFHEQHRRIFSAMGAVAEAGSPLDVLTLKAELERRGDLEACGGAVYLGVLLDGVPHAANAAYYAGIVRSKCRRRALARLAEDLRKAASDGGSDETIAHLLVQIENARVHPADAWTRSTLEGVTNPEAGTVHYVVEGLIPAGETTILAATWKAGKTLVVYRLVLDAISQRKALGYYTVSEAVKTVIFQIEMPSSEDDRRFRRLAIGCGMYPEEVPGYVQAGMLTVYNRPALNLTRPEDVARFQATVLDGGYRLVVIDSLIAAFAGADINDNSTVREHFAKAFGPLTSAGVAVLLLHHKRKTQGGKASRDDDRSALLGAQAWGAAAGRIYALERLNAEPGQEPPGPSSAFHVRMSLTGSWTPEETPDVIVAVEDTTDGGTTVRVINEDEQFQKGGLTTVQRVALCLAKIVRARGRVRRQDAIKEAMADLDLSEASVKRGLDLARIKRWITVEKSVAGSYKERDLVPGDEE